MNRYVLVKQSVVRAVNIGSRVDLILEPGTELEYDGSVVWVVLNGSKYDSTAPVSDVVKLADEGNAREISCNVT